MRTPATNRYQLIEIELKGKPQPPVTITDLDPLKVDPKHYQLELENDHVRVVRVRFGPLENGVVHQHVRNYLVVYMTKQAKGDRGDVRLHFDEGTTTHTENNPLNQTGRADCRGVEVDRGATTARESNAGGTDKRDPWAPSKTNGATASPGAAPSKRWPAFWPPRRSWRSQQDPFRDHSRVPGIDELLTTFDFEAVAFAKLPSQTYHYTAHGTESEYTLRRNREAFDWVQLVPRAIATVSSIDASTEVLGTQDEISAADCALSSGHGALHPEGEVATHRGASAAWHAHDSQLRLQLPRRGRHQGRPTGRCGRRLYGREKFEENLPLVENVQAVGFKAIVLTVDQTAAYYERVQHMQHLSGRGNRGGRSSRAAAAPIPKKASNPYHIRYDRLWYNWPFIEKIRPYIKVPFLAKGILTADDAKLCVESGLDGIIVSNHGGRSMDYGASTLEMLPEIVDAVAGRIPVLVDSGFRRGSDALIALALGAKAVCLGRVPRWGLAAFGDAGVQRVLEIMQAELALAMAQTGRPNLASIDRTLVRTHFPWAK